MFNSNEMANLGIYRLRSITVNPNLFNPKSLTFISHVVVDEELSFFFLPFVTLGLLLNLYFEQDICCTLCQRQTAKNKIYDAARENCFKF